MKKYNVSGMSCAACSARVEKAVLAVDGVESCAVNLLTNSMTVAGNADSASIISAVRNAGYGASEAESDRAQSNSASESEVKPMVVRLIFSAVVLVLLMYVIF